MSLKNNVKMFVDDVRNPPKGWLLARSVKKAKEILKTRRVVEASLDFWFGIPHQANGYTLACWMVDNKICPRVVRVHSLGSWDGMRMARKLKRNFPRKRIFYKPIDKPL